jgi:hypothetical protein
MDSSTEGTTGGDGTRPGAEHLLVFSHRETAEQVAEELAEEGFASVGVVRAAGRRQDDAAPGWAVHVVDHRLPDASGSGAYEGLRERFAALATEHDGWYDEPGDPRPVVTSEDDS